MVYPGFRMEEDIPGNISTSSPIVGIKATIQIYSLIISASDVSDIEDSRPAAVAKSVRSL